MSRFQPLSAYEGSLADGYRLLPFRFTRLDGDDYVLTNQAGEFIVLDRITIEKFVRHDLPAQSPVYGDLKSKHFLLDADSGVAIDLLALKVRTKLRRLANFTGLHLFVVSLRCEHSCPYCQVSRQSDDKIAYDMSIETAEKALALVFRSPSPALKIEFQGGEPLLNFPLIRHIVERAEDINRDAQRNLQFVIATNLALINDEILEFCKTHDVLISTSLDGPSDLHNKNRPRPGRDSYERAIAGIQKVRTVLGRDRVSALMTTTEASLPRVRDIIDEYVAQGFEGIFLRPMSPYGFAVKTKSYNTYDTERWLKFYFDGLDYILELNKAGHFFVEHYASIILTKILTPFSPGYVDLTSPAAIGIGVIVYNYDGEVYASDESRMLAEMGDHTFRLGNVHKHSYQDIFLSDTLLTPIEESFAASVPMCNECAFEPFCGADPVFHHTTQGDFVGRKPTSAFCNRNMAIFRKLISLVGQDDDARRIFLRWINP
ncbi:MAG TPA: His-Xaa-Ser system radical SAM maturase HxsB [Blastocatellia bacterium]|nr:His-Xaa-Ser system radical SAM maturase HxsB [Blastocatellia bacterium]